MSAAVLPGLGTVLQCEFTNPTYTAISNAVTIDGPDMEVGEADTTYLGSAVKTNRPTLADGGELNLKIWYDPTDTTVMQPLMTMFTGLTSKPWKLIFNSTNSTGKTAAFTGWIKKFQPTGMEIESNVEADLTIRLDNGPPTFS